MFDFDMKLLSYSTFEDGIIMKYTVEYFNYIPEKG